MVDAEGDRVFGRRRRSADGDQNRGRAAKSHVRENARTITERLAARARARLLSGTPTLRTGTGEERDGVAWVATRNPDFPAPEQGDPGIIARFELPPEERK